METPGHQGLETRETNLPTNANEGTRHHYYFAPISMIPLVFLLIPLVKGKSLHV